jgi:DnaK suppressor protein
VALRSANSPRKRLLVHLSQAVETLALRREPSTHQVPLEGALQGSVKVQFLEVSRPEFGHFENVSNALIRLDKGTYGRCTRCGQRIDASVLSETPWATRCLGCGDQESQP